MPFVHGTFQIDKNLAESGREPRIPVSCARPTRQGVGNQAIASSIALARTPRSIGWVSLPVNVFCWLGWYEPITT